MERHFDEELKELKEKLLRMASLAEQAIALAVKSLVERDRKIAGIVIASDEDINMIEMEIDEICLRLLALRQPIAADLRFIAAAMKINSDLERIGDLAVNIAQRSVSLMKEPPPANPLLDIPHMASLTQQMVRDSLNAFVNQDVSLAREVCRRDDAVDDINHQIFRVVLTYMIQEPKTIARGVDLILIGRHLERIADHATNIAEDVVFIVKGKTIKHHIEEKEESGQWRKTGF